MDVCLGIPRNHYNPPQAVDETADETESMFGGGLGSSSSAGGGSGKRQMTGQKSLPTPTSTPGRNKKEETRKCRTCKKNKPVDTWPVNCPHCRDCRQAMENVGAAAKKAGKKTWWAEVQKDEIKLQAVLKDYNTQCPALPGKPRKPFAVVKYLEFQEAASGVLRDGIQTMMHKDRWLAYAQTPQCREGQMTATQATTRWEAMLVEAADGIRKSDEDGPPNATKRVSVKTDDLVISRDMFMSGRRQEAQQRRESKNVSVEEVEAGRRNLLREHDAGTGTGGSADLNSIGQAMVTRAADGQGAFTGPGVYLPDVECLEAAVEEHQKAKADKKRQSGASTASAGQTEGGEDSDDAMGDKEPAPPPQWLDVGFVVRQQRTVETQHQKCVDECAKTLKEACAAMHAFGKDASTERERGVLLTRLPWLLATAGYKQVKADYSWEEGTASAFTLDKETDGGRNDLARLQREIAVSVSARPPCQDPLELQCLDLLSQELQVKFEALQQTASSKEPVLAQAAIIKKGLVAAKRLQTQVAAATKALNQTQVVRKRKAAPPNASEACAGMATQERPTKRNRGAKKVLFQAVQERPDSKVVEILKKQNTPESGEADATGQEFATSLDPTHPAVFRNSGALKILACVSCSCCHGADSIMHNCTTCD